MAPTTTATLNSGAVTNIAGPAATLLGAHPADSHTTPSLTATHDPTPVIALLTASTLAGMGDTPLHVAARCGSSSVLSLFLTALEAAGDLRPFLAPNAHGDTPFALSAAHPACDAVLRAVTAAAKDSRAQLTWPALHAGACRAALSAAGRGDVCSIEALLAASSGVDPTLAARIAALPLLHAACRGGHLSAIRYLLSAGIDPDPPLCQSGLASRTPLALAAAAGDVQVLTALLQAGADVDRRGLFGAQAIHFAALGGHVDAVRALIAAGAEVNGVTTALAVAPGGVATRDAITRVDSAGMDTAANGHSAGVDTDIAGLDSANGHSVAEVVPSNAASAHAPQPLPPALASLWLPGSCPVGPRALSTPLHAAIAAGCVATVRELLRAGADVRVATADGLPPIHLALALSWGGQMGRGSHVAEDDRRNGALIALLRELVAAGADVASRVAGPWGGATPLHLTAAAMHGQAAAQAVAMLAGAGAGVEEPAFDGSLPMHWAARHGNTCAAGALMRAGARADAAAVPGMLGWEGSREVQARVGVRVTPLTVAVMWGHEALGLQLVEAGAGDAGGAGEASGAAHEAQRRGCPKLAARLAWLAHARG